MTERTRWVAEPHPRRPGRYRVRNTITGQAYAVTYHRLALAQREASRRNEPWKAHPDASDLETEQGEDL
jgi:hypothetical protein